MEPADETIVALSSGMLPSAIAIIRVSGAGAGDACDLLAGSRPPIRRASHRTLRIDGEAIDDAIVLWCPGPASATGEDVAEFHVHGSRAVVTAIVSALTARDGVRAAEPGEFTRRAYENGRIDLIGAEAIDDLIHADTDAQRRQAQRQRDGLLGDRVSEWRDRLVEAMALVAASIDFADEDDVADDAFVRGLTTARALRQTMVEALAASGRSERLRDGLVVAIAGAPNVGKSSLLNALARRDAAIVSPSAGTTRDPIEVALTIGGYPVILVDTAGLRDTTDPVELQGIARARSRAEAADLVLWLRDRDDPPPAFPRVWTVATKIDLGDRGAAADHAISASTGAGIDGLLIALADYAADYFGGDAGILTRVRHRQAVSDAIAALDEALADARPEVVAENLRKASVVLGRLVGAVDVEDLLGDIFSRFCIGK